MRKVKTRIDVYQLVTDKIIEALDEGVLPWNKSWSVSGGNNFPTRYNGEYYKGINVLLLGLTQYTNPNWMTWNQAAETCGLKKNEDGKWINEDGKGVRAGEKGTTVVYYGNFKVEDTDAPKGGPKRYKTIPFPKTYTVFNAQQIDNLPDKFFPEPAKPMQTGVKNKAIDAYAKTLGVHGTLNHDGGDVAFYKPSSDTIHMPTFEQFHTSEDYYCTLFHEYTHWTKTKARCNRDMKSYALEELVAEMGAAFLMSRWGLASKPRPDHAQYIKSWLSALRGDKKAIFTASKKAQEAVAFIMGDKEKEATQQKAA